ncbi:MAG: phage terminase small subunit-related protein, partial [Dehalococcoidia bacterium]
KPSREARRSVAKAKRNPKKTPGKSRINWTEARDYYAYSFTKTLDDVAKKYGVALSTVRRRSAMEKWKDLRNRARDTNLAEIATEGLKRAFEDRAEAVEALLRVEYRESLSHAQQMQKLRKLNGNAWAPRNHKAHAETMGLLFNRIRLSLGLPTEIAANLDDEKQKIPMLYVPEQAQDYSGEEQQEPPKKKAKARGKRTTKA